MNKSSKTTIRFFLFWIIAILIFVILQNVFTNNKYELLDCRISTIRNMPDDEVQVLFLGTSHAECAISPMYLYEKTGVKAYNLCTPLQPIEGSYFLLKEVLENTRQTPEVVVLDASGLFKEERGKNAWRYILDNMPLSKNKMDMIRCYVDLEVNNADTLSAIVPFLLYHDRWNALNDDDFRRVNTAYYSAGQYIVSTITPGGYENVIADTVIPQYELKKDGTRIYYSENGIIYDSFEDIEYFYDPVESAVSYFEKIKLLCDNNDIQLIISKAPVRGIYSEYGIAWTKDRHEAMCAFSSKYDIPFIDLSYGENEIDIDLTIDTMDAGYHLNLLGSEKTTDYWCEYFKKSDLYSSDNMYYDESLAVFKKVQTVAHLQMETDFEKYLKKLVDNRSKWIILISVKDDYKDGITPGEWELFHILGLQVIDLASFREGYIAIIECGSVTYEETSNRQIEFEKTLLSGDVVSLASCGYLNIGYESIVVNGEEESCKWSGMNFVILDAETHSVIDSVAFVAWDPMQAVYRNNGSVFNYLREYEDRLSKQ